MTEQIEPYQREGSEVMRTWAFRIMSVWIFTFTTLIWHITFEQGVFEARLWDFAAYACRWLILVGVPFGCIYAFCRDYDEAAAREQATLRFLEELRALLSARPK